MDVYHAQSRICSHHCQIFCQTPKGTKNANDGNYWTISLLSSSPNPFQLKHSSCIRCWPLCNSLFCYSESSAFLRNYFNGTRYLCARTVRGDNWIICVSERKQNVPFDKCQRFIRLVPFHSLNRKKIRPKTPDWHHRILSVESVERSMAEMSTFSVCANLTHMFIDSKWMASQSSVNTEIPFTHWNTTKIIAECRQMLKKRRILSRECFSSIYSLQCHNRHRRPKATHKNVQPLFNFLDSFRFSNANTFTAIILILTAHTKLFPSQINSLINETNGEHLNVCSLIANENRSSFTPLCLSLSKPMRLLI